MAYQQVRTILQHVEDFHHRSAEEFRRLARRCPGERTAMLLSYLARHERSLAETIGDYLAEAPDRVLSTWVTTDVETAALANTGRARITSPVPTEDDVLEAALERDERVQNVYEDLAYRDSPAWVSEAFLTLLDMEKQHERQIARQAGRMADL